MSKELHTARYWTRWLLCWLLLTLAACQLQPASVLPTLVATAAVQSSTVAAANLSGIPPTWTPGAQAEVTLSRQIRPATATPASAVPQADLQATATVPTNTPIPPTATATPIIVDTPTATPYVSYIPSLPPSEELGASKLGIHVILNSSPSIMQFVREAQPAVMKAVGDVGFLEEVEQVSPRTITIGRIGIEDQSYAGNPEEAARRLVAEQLPQYQANPFVDYWEGWNEPDPNLDRMSWYARFEQERVREMARYGFRAAIGGFSVGVPELDEFMLFLPAIETAIAHQGILSLHEYGAPTIDYLFGDPLPGYPSYPDRGPLAFRYRWYYRDILEPAGLVIPLVISEFGIDGLIGMGRPGPNGSGWKEFGSYWRQNGLWGANRVEAYINQIAWYDAGVRQDGYVIGFTIFTAGGGRRWRSYDVTDILPQLTDYVRSQQ